MEEISNLPPLDDQEKQELLDFALLAPIGKQEVWASGVTYLKSKEARMEESEKAGGGGFYDKVYEASRPELFFKATPQRVAAPGKYVRIRKDSSWNVPEPEWTLFINALGNIAAYTLGNDMSSRSIEGENPLYLPQAKTYEGCAALGPCLYIPKQSFPEDAIIQLDIHRNSQSVFSQSISIGNMKRTPEELVDYLLRELTFPFGCFLMTGTGIVPPDHFTLHAGDTIYISMEPIGTLVNEVSPNII